MFSFCCSYIGLCDACRGLSYSILRNVLPCILSEKDVVDLFYEREKAENKTVNDYMTEPAVHSILDYDSEDIASLESVRRVSIFLISQAISLMRYNINTNSITRKIEKDKHRSNN